MIKVNRLFVYGLLIALVVMLNGALVMAQNVAWNIDSLMDALGRIKSAHATFVETKTIALLEKPVDSSGELSYTAPNHLEKRTFRPVSESLLLDGDSLTVERRGKKRVLQLQTYPEVAAFIESIRGTLAGDRKALERNFNLRLEGTEQKWKLTLAPANNDMKKVVESLTMAGSGGELRTITVNQADGDSSVMTITTVKP